MSSSGSRDEHGRGAGRRPGPRPRSAADRAILIAPPLAAWPSAPAGTSGAGRVTRAMDTVRRGSGLAVPRREQTSERFQYS
ncbi:hypothetical protein F4561_006203 [Lipingzhangella halophila]|uniref:Uncharacterized protein n=1 Tax=Lipingzhangella halophila TaxID=1783352 RepID=A0A7W7W6U3_9ACTN|nr:hypothetical protein [Lipingzhangella halophila]